MPKCDRPKLSSPRRSPYYFSCIIIVSTTAVFFFFLASFDFPSDRRLKKNNIVLIIWALDIGVYLGFEIWGLEFTIRDLSFL
jgi:hypothetical protein